VLYGVPIKILKLRVCKKSFGDGVALLGGRDLTRLPTTGKN
jgi:hypothetical protein